MSFKQKFNFYSNLFLIVLLFVFGVVWAESNGVWHNVADIRGGTFALDEQANTNNFTFINSVFINNNLSVNGSVNVHLTPIKDNHSANKAYFDAEFSSLVPSILDCNKQGMIYNGSTCIYVNGSDVIPNIFDFPLIDTAEFNTWINSSEVVLGGFGANMYFELLNNNSQVSIIKNGVDTGLLKIGVNEGDKIKIRILSKGDYSLVSSVNVKLGTYTTFWSVTTKPLLPAYYLTPGTYTYTVPGSSITSITVEVQGAGGGGAINNCAGQKCYYGSGGGGAGGYAKSTRSVLAGQQFSVIVGGGSNWGTIGGQSSFNNTFLYAAGGQPGYPYTSGSDAGGSGGVSYNGNILNKNGASGSAGATGGDGIYHLGIGGKANVHSNCGDGGNGGYGNSADTHGRDGCVIISYN